MEAIKGNIFNIQRYSIDDGPGIRTTVFMKGCPLSCLWCSNPESQKSIPELSHRDHSCNHCGKCVEVCELKAIMSTDNGVNIDRDLCNCCGKCVDVCDPGALKIFGQAVTVDEVFEQITKDRDYYKITGGGITASGGEPLAQPEFVSALFKKCCEAGIHTCMDTSGYGSIEALEKVLPFTRLVLFDLKHMDPDLHRKYTGCDNAPVIRNLKRIVNEGTTFIIRIPLIPGVNDLDDQVKAFARAVVGIAGSTEINIMPYHRYGQGKYKVLDRTYPLGELEPPTDEKLNSVKEIFQSFGLNCEVKV
ncbi:MAG: glycyl-radical enzyme activating protein [Bacillota bacterium]|nr:glycyl-radical enzyme activating protein [Bacillota bacterium]